MTNHAEIADQLWTARTTGGLVPSIAQANPDLTLDDAYAVQAQMFAKHADAGHVVSGRKLGVTAAGGMKMFNITEPVHGLLWAEGDVANGGTIKIEGACMQPKIETEIGFIIGTDINSVPADMDALAAAVEAVVPCYEVPSSRVDGWPKGIQDLVADSTGFAHYVLGDGRAKPADLDLASMAITIVKNGEEIATGTGAECMGNPMDALMWLVEKVVAKGEGLKKGDLILTGALGGMHAAVPGDTFSSEFAGLGSVSVSFA